MKRTIFIPSMIEVQFGDYYKACAKLLFNEGFQNFHVDIGDNFSIGRELQPWDKVSFLKELGAEIKLTAHLMCKSGTHLGGLEETAKRCASEGFDIIYIHPRSFYNFEQLTEFKESIFNNNYEMFGVVSELEKSKNSSLIDFVRENRVKNVLQMGVPIGRGGQTFGIDAVNRIRELHIECSNLSMVELDGGLTFVIKKLKGERLCRFSGWSLIAHETPEQVRIKAIELREHL